MGLAGDTISTVFSSDKRQAQFKAENLTTPPVADVIKDGIIDLGYGVGGGAADADPERMLKGLTDWIEHTFVALNQGKKAWQYNTPGGLTEQIKKSVKRGPGGMTVPRAGKKRRVNRLVERRKLIKSIVD